jgi:Immunity protein 50
MPSDEWITTNISGSKDLIEWFESWPSFHDAEIIEVHLSRTSTSWLKVHTWRTTKETDARGYFVRDKHVVVTLKLQGIQDLDLNGFNHQNVIFGLTMEPAENGIRITLEDCFGLAGELVTKQVALEISPGIPVSE